MVLCWTKKVKGAPQICSFMWSDNFTCLARKKIWNLEPKPTSLVDKYVCFRRKDGRDSGHINGLLQMSL